MNDVQSFALSQLLLAEQRGAHNHVLLNEKQQEITRLSSEINDISVKCNNLDIILRQAERKTIEDVKELNELKEAYKEKHRKCMAWEKAYNSIRDQLGGGKSTSSTTSRNQDGNTVTENIANNQLVIHNDPVDYKYKQNYDTRGVENKSVPPYYPQQAQQIAFPQSYLDAPYINQNAYRDRPITPNTTALPLPTPTSYNTDGQQQRYEQQRQIPSSYSDAMHRSSHILPSQAPTGNNVYTHNRDVSIRDVPPSLQHSPPANKTLKRMEITTITNTKHVHPTSNAIQEYNHMEVNQKRSNNWVATASNKYVATNKYQKRASDESFEADRRPRNQDSVESTSDNARRTNRSKRFFDTQEHPKITW